MIAVFPRSTGEGWWETAEGAVCDAMEGGKRLASSDGRDVGALVVAKKQKREEDTGEERTVGEKKVCARRIKAVCRTRRAGSVEADGLDVDWKRRG